MRIRNLLIIITIMVVQTSWAQPNISSRKAYLNHLEMLYEEARHNYADIGNKVQLKRIIDAYDTAIDQGIHDGILTQHDIDSLLLNIKREKLWGDYYYLGALTQHEIDSMLLNIEKAVTLAEQFDLNYFPNSYTDQNTHDEAEKRFKNALAYAEDPSYAQHQDIFYYQFVLHEELGQLYYKQKRYEEAYNEMKAAQKRSSYLSNDDLLDFISQLAMCEARMGEYKEALDNIDFVINKYQGKKTERYGEALRKKAKILMLQKENVGTGMVTPDDEAVKCYKEYFTLKKTDAIERLGNMNAEDREQYWMHIRPFVVDCYRTEGADPAFLYDVTLFGKALLLEYARKGQPEFSTWKQVQKKLKEGECAIEFIQYEKNGEKRMGALILKKKGEPQFVRLGNINELLKTSLDEGGNVYMGIVSDSFTLKNRLYNDSTLYDKVWTPDLLNAIGKDTRKLYFAPDGIFHILAIEYMIPDKPQLTSLKTEDLYRLTSTRQLLAKDIKTSGQRMLLCGGINYSETPTGTIDNTTSNFTNDEQTYLFIKELTQGISPSDTVWSQLDGAQMEVDSIEKIYGTKKTRKIIGTEAAELKVANMMAEYPIIHLSTHGYFGGTFSLGTDLLPANYDASLSQNLVALSGADFSLHDEDFDGSQHDGMFSAREIMQMDYSNIELIVISACQTGLGYITDDGVYGLQRGLKNAGVKGMVISLWSVSDAATCLLMQSFYTHLQNEDAHTAFMHARQELIDKFKNEYNSYYPCFYNAFILIDVK